MDQQLEKSAERAYILKNNVIKSDYSVDDRFQPANSVEETHTTQELLHYAESGQCEIEARVIASGSKGNAFASLNTKEFIESAKYNNKTRFKESSFDSFMYDDYYTGGNVGTDFMPLMGGPYNKQLYMYDYLKMHAASFHAYNHDPMGKRIVHIIRDYTLGRGYSVDCKNKLALAVWKAFCEANNFNELLDYAALELSIYGEVIWWELPNDDIYIGYNLRDEQEIPKGKLPRFRLIDPSVIWEIITYPEDITRKLAYVWVAPTQYQIYSSTNWGERVPGMKFIYQQIPANQVLHYKVNSVSNEKRGRSDLFSVLGYLKRLRDSVDYSILGLQKNMAWSIDTSIEGSQADIDAYVRSQQELGTIPPAGSEFVHSKKIERQYLSNLGGGKGGNSNAFDWALTMIAGGSGIPISYLGSHLTGGSTRASALVATEPTVKMFEKRREVYERILQDISRRVLSRFGIKDDLEFTFPELIVQDRSQKIKDIVTADLNGYISKDTAASIVASELDITHFNYEKEKEMMQNNVQVMPEQMTNPLTAPGMDTDFTTDQTGFSNEMKSNIRDQNV